jgi:4-diphosphocytidyl-2-C-methyl-D-erythritol kinase
MVPINLFDTLRLTRRDDGRIELITRWALPALSSKNRAQSLPPPADNLAYRAVDLLRQRAGVQMGIRLELIKRIPAAAGLGGGSSDAAAALVGANWLWNVSWDRRRLAEVAAEIGSDVPFFLYGSSAWCRGRGEQVEPCPLGTRHHFVVACPDQGLSTAAVYATTRLRRMPESDPDVRRPTLSGMESTSHPGRLAEHLFNRLQPAAEQLAPWLQSVQREFHRLDVLGHQMSGSGSAYFGVCRNAEHALRVATTIRSRVAYRVFPAATVGSRPHYVVPVSQN